ncbi:MAG: hypothetical protein LBH43_02400 [Treponema sp.]|nr:hypothetical protein [Treponema sp.]
MEYKGAGHTFGELREAFKIPPITYYGWEGKLQNGCFEKSPSGSGNGKQTGEN